MVEGSRADNRQLPTLKHPQMLPSAAPDVIRTSVEADELELSAYNQVVEAIGEAGTQNSVDFKVRYDRQIEASL